MTTKPKIPMPDTIALSSLRPIFKKAAELIRRDGWTQNDYGPRNLDHYAPRCILGACDTAGLGVSEYHTSLVRFTLEKHVGVSAIATWNDDPKRTEADVLAVLDKLALPS